MNYFKKYPLDISLCIAFSLILIPMVMLDITSIFRIILGLPFIIFIPGYLFIYVLFPTKKLNEGISRAERFILSIAFSITSTSLITLGLNYTSFGINQQSIFVSIMAFSIIFGMLALYRWKTTYPDERFFPLFKNPLKKSKNQQNIMINIGLILVIIISVVCFFYILSYQNMGEKFTEFYLLGENYEAADYPFDLASGENSTVIMGINNHEFRTVDYTVEVWLINESKEYDSLLGKNFTIYHNAWFMNKFPISLDHNDLDISGAVNPGWIYNYTFNINQTSGEFRLAFLLYDSDTQDYDANIDYKDEIEEKIDNSYRMNYLWVNIV